MSLYAAGQTLDVIPSLQNRDKPAGSIFVSYLKKPLRQFDKLSIRKGEIPQGIADPGIKPGGNKDKVRPELLHGPAELVTKKRINLRIS